jgi:alanine dehydrogenase
MPAVVARTATMGLTNALLPYVQEVGEMGMVNALRQNPGLGRGVCTFGGYCTNEAIARVFDFKAKSLSSLISESENS